MFPEQEEITRILRHLLHVFVTSECEIRPHFFLTGPSGSGKSYLVSQIAEEMGVPVLEINAAQLTSEGISGNSLSKALTPMFNYPSQPMVIFVDEFDKIVQSNGHETENYKAAVQDEFLRVLESNHASVFGKYGHYERVNMAKTLFIFAGAFSNQKIETIEDLRDTGLRTEFVGRVPLVFHTDSVSLDSMLAVLPRVKLLRDYLKIFPDKTLKQAQRAISNMLREKAKTSIIGLRLINATIHEYFMG